MLPSSYEAVSHLPLCSEGPRTYSCGLITAFARGIAFFAWAAHDDVLLPLSGFVLSLLLCVCVWSKLYLEVPNTFVDGYCRNGVVTLQEVGLVAALFEAWPALLAHALSYRGPLNSGLSRDSDSEIRGAEVFLMFHACPTKAGRPFSLHSIDVDSFVHRGHCRRRRCSLITMPRLATCRRLRHSDGLGSASRNARWQRVNRHTNTFQNRGSSIFSAAFSSLNANGNVLLLGRWRCSHCWTARARPFRLETTDVTAPSCEASPRPSLIACPLSRCLR
jgi:hypothetical protein